MSSREMICITYLSLVQYSANHSKSIRTLPESPASIPQQTLTLIHENQLLQHKHSFLKGVYLQFETTEEEKPTMDNGKIKPDTEVIIPVFFNSISCIKWNYGFACYLKDLTFWHQNLSTGIHLHSSLAGTNLILHGVLYSILYASSYIIQCYFNLAFQYFFFIYSQTNGIYQSFTERNCSMPPLSHLCYIKVIHFLSQ